MSAAAIDTILYIGAVVLGTMRSGKFTIKQLNQNTNIVRGVTKGLFDTKDFCGVLDFLVKSGLLERMEKKGGGSEMFPLIFLVRSNKFF
jgi:hypothetical protein